MPMASSTGASLLHGCWVVRDHIQSACTARPEKGRQRRGQLLRAQSDLQEGRLILRLSDAYNFDEPVPPGAVQGLWEVTRPAQRLRSLLHSDTALYRDEVIEL